MVYLEYFDVFERDVYYNSFAYFVNEEREKLQNKYGQNWNKFVSIEDM